MASTTTTAQTDTPSAARPPPPQHLSIRWRVVVPIVMIGAVVLLMALPLGAVWIVSNSGCCVFDGMENVATFWGALTAGFLALFGMLIAGVYVITAFRTDATARAEARDAVATYIDRHRKSFYKDLNKFHKTVKQRTECVVLKSTEVIGKIESHREEVTKAAKEASDGIVLKLKDVEDQRSDAVRRIDAARGAVETAANTAREAVEAATEVARDAAQAAADAQDTVRAAVEAAIEQINDATNRLPPTSPPGNRGD